MAKAQEKTANAAPAESTEVGPVDMSMARPDWLPKDSYIGTEGIGKEDARLPRIALAQKGTPEADPDDPRYIEGIIPGTFFNSLTKDVLANKTTPILFTIIRQDKPRWIEFIPMLEGGGVRDFDVKIGDPRTKFTKGQDGKSVPPLATKFYEWVVVIKFGGTMIPVGLSMKGMSLKTALDLNGLILNRRADLFAGVYELNRAPEKNAKGSYFIYTVKNAGWVSRDLYATFKSLYETFKDKEVSIDREQMGEEPDDSMAASGDGDGGDTEFGTESM